MGATEPTEMASHAINQDIMDIFQRGDSTNQWIELMGCHMFPKNAKKTLAHSETIHDSLKQWCVTIDRIRPG